MKLPTIDDYSASIEVPALIRATKLNGGHAVKKSNRPIKYSGGFCVVFPYENKGKKYAVRCWHAAVNDIQNRTMHIADALNHSGLPYFVDFEYVKNGIMTSQGMQPLVIMDWIDALPLKKYIAQNIDNPTKLLSLAESFKTMVGELHKANFAHGDLQHGNIMVKNDGSIVLVDYDSMYVPALAGSTDEIKGLAGYQHPARWKNKILTEKVDYFSELIIYTSLVGLSKFPELWTRLNLKDSETMLFSAEDISSPETSQTFSLLSNDSDTNSLVEKIKEFLSKKGLDELEPLERAVIDKRSQYLGGLSDKWKDNGYRKQSLSDIGKTAGQISTKW